jgi:hypothetical protein
VEEGAMSIYKRGGVYWFKFMWNGQLIRESTKQCNDKVARQIEAARRTALAKGEVGLKKKKPAPLLRDFLKNDFLPFAQARHADKPLTLRYYQQGANMLSKSPMAGMKLDELTDQYAQAFAARHSRLSPSGIVAFAHYVERQIWHISGTRSRSQLRLRWRKANASAIEF